MKKPKSQGKEWRRRWTLLGMGRPYTGEPSRLRRGQNPKTEGNSGLGLPNCMVEKLQATSPDCEANGSATMLV